MHRLVTCDTLQTLDLQWPAPAGRYVRPISWGAGCKMSHSMRRFVLSTLVCLLSGAVFAVTGPKDRQPTDPKQVTSQTNASSRPVPVDDLLFSRRVGGPAW